MAAGWFLARQTAEVAETVREPELLSADGIENLWRLPLSKSSAIYSGGQPDGDAGFAALRKLGVKTLISVDGARPQVELAAKYGLRYVHLPIGYDDVPAERLATMVAAAKWLPGPVFVHCHHGKHRGPAAAVCLWRSLRDDIRPDAGTKTLQRMGTAEKYRGLYRAAVREPPAVRDIQLATREFPEVTAVAPLAEQMVGIDHVWEQIRELLKSETLTEEQQHKLDELFTDGAERFRESSRFAGGRLSDELFATSILWDDAANPNSDAYNIRPNDLFERQCQKCHARHRDGE